MEYKLLEEQDLELMLDFVDDENTKYSIDVLYGDSGYEISTYYFMGEKEIRK